MNPNNGTLMVAKHKPSAGNERILSGEQIISLGLAVDDQKTALGSSKKVMLHIDAIELVHMGQGGFIYRLLLSNPIHLQVDQPLTLTAGRTHGSQPIQASILHVADQQIVIFCRSALPEDIRLVRAEFDPGFILDALREFIEHKNNAPSGLAHQLARRSIPTAHAPATRTSIQGLNNQQLAGLRKMLTGPMHFLWGPPGTGKTWTVGAAIAEWLRRKRSVLIVSTSNVAVDIALKAAITHINAPEAQAILRLGNTDDPDLSGYTVSGKVVKDPRIAGCGSNHIQCVQQRLQEVREQLTRLFLSCRRQNCTSDSTGRELMRLSEEKTILEAEISKFQGIIDERAQSILDESSAVGCTLATMVLQKKLHNRLFDVVVVDETSMVPLAYAVAASMLAKKMLVYAGDPYQLSPICDSNSCNARHWFGQNVYDWLNIEQEYDDGRRTDAISLLKKQYRMTNQIGSFVSGLTYHGRLEHARAQDGPEVEFVDLPEEWCKTYYSVGDKSYYHVGVVPLIHEILANLGPNRQDVLLLSPFRSQQTLMRLTISDLVSARQISEPAVSCKTVHRAQGSQARAVIVDLTAHASDSVQAFFREAGSRNLLNVALSRAKDHLIILGSQRLVDRLADEDRDFWGRFRELLKEQDSIYSATEILPEAQPFRCVRSMIEQNRDASLKKPAIAVVGDHPDTDQVIEALRRVEASRKLLVLPSIDAVAGPFIVRPGDAGKYPSLLVAGGYVFLPLDGRWIGVKSPNAARVIWRIGFSRLADGEVDAAEECIFHCDCGIGYLTIESSGDGWILQCDNRRNCRHTHRLSLHEAKVKVRLSGMTCPDKHPWTVRRSDHGGLFLGCENYPICTHTESLSILRGY